MIQKKITAGDTIKFRLKAPANLDVTTHRLYVAIRGNVPINLEGILTADLSSFDFVLSGDDSADLKAGQHYYQIYSDLIDNTDTTDKTTLSTDFITVVPSFVDVDDEQDLRSQDEIQLDAINKIITKRLNGDDATEEYSTVGGRSIRKASLEELLKIRDSIEKRIRLIAKSKKVGATSLEKLYVMFHDR